MKRKYFLMIGLLLTFVFGSAYSRSLKKSTIIFQSTIQESGWEITGVDIKGRVTVSHCHSSLTFPYKIPPKTALAISIVDCYLKTGEPPGSMNYNTKISFKNVNTGKTMSCNVAVSCPTTTAVLWMPCTYTFTKNNLDWKATLSASKENPNVRLQVTDK